MAYTPRNPNGQATMANSEPVVIASNQSAVPVTQSGTWDEVGINDSGNSITVDNGGTFAVQESGGGLISTNNSSTATLGVGAAFTGTADEITNYSSVSVYVISNVASATDGLSIQQSNDGTNWDNTDVYTIPAATGKAFGVQCVGRYLRVVYTNGGTIQASFRLQTILHKYMQRNSTVRPQDARSNENDFSEDLSYQMNYNGSTWDRERNAAAVNAITNATETGIPAAGVGPGFSRVDTSQTITANSQSRTINAKGTEQMGITITGTWTGTMVFEYTVDGSTWVQDTTGVDANTLYQTSGTTTANGSWFFDSSSVLQYRVRSTAWTSGTAVITFIGSVGSAITYGPIINARPDRIGVAPTWKSANYTTTQTGAAMWTPASGKKINLTYLAVSSYATTGARVIIWYGASGDTTYTAGTDQLVWAGSFAPSATSKPGAILNFTVPIQANTADYVLRITTDAGISLDISMYGYES